MHVAAGECVQDQWLACRRAAADELNAVCHKRHGNANHIASAFDSSPLVWREKHLQWMNAGIRGNPRKCNCHDNDHADPQSDLPSPTMPTNLHERSDTFTLWALDGSNPVRTSFGAPSVLLAERVQRMQGHHCERSAGDSSWTHHGDHRVCSSHSEKPKERSTDETCSHAWSRT